RDEQGGHGPVADDVVEKNPRVGGEQGSSLGMRQTDQIAVVDVNPPAGVVAGGTQPAGQAAQHGVAGEAGLGTAVHRRTLAPSLVLVQVGILRRALADLLRDPRILALWLRLADPLDVDLVPPVVAE